MARRQPNPWKVGTTIGPWELLERLGSGGNGEVWKARRTSDGKEAALKLLHEKHSDPEASRYRRFRDEQTAHLTLLQQPGVLPLVDYHLPESPTESDPAWLATELAEPLPDILAQAPLRTVVEAIAAIADSVAELHKGGFFHRDIKPNNLYRLSGRWVVGDLGLIDFPGKEGLTESNECLGPMLYLAPEMLHAGHVDDASKADVYSLAKTLWTLGTRLPHPFQGQMRVDEPGRRLSKYASDPQAPLLDLLLEQATSDDPLQRPTMREFADSLTRWLTPRKTGPRPLDLSALKERIKTLTVPALRAEERRRWLERQARSAFEVLLATLLNRIAPEVTQTVDGQRRSYTDGNTQERFWGGHLHPNNRVWGNNQVIEVATPGDEPYTLRALILCNALENGEIQLLASYTLDRHRQNAYDNNRTSVVWRAQRAVKAGSVEQESVTHELAERMVERLPDLLTAYADAAERRLAASAAPQQDVSLPEDPKQIAPPCVYRGKARPQKADWSTPQGLFKIAVYGCAQFGNCTIEGEKKPLAYCPTCKKRKESEAVTAPS